ncbi:MAG: leucine--tRNA ligase, partial [Candidatus Nitrosotenuis sp.]
MIDWNGIEEKWRKKWQESKDFETNPNSKEKKFITVAYPYPNSPQHIGHGRTYTLADVHARFLRMKGYNVLFPMGFHYTGTPILGMAKRVQEGDKELIQNFRELYHVPEDKIKEFVEPVKIADYFHEEIKAGMIEMGYSIDWRREFTTIDPAYQKFIEWQVNTLRKKNLIIQGSHPVGWCPKDQNPVSQHDTLGDVEPDFTEYILIKFIHDGYVIPTATLRPETLFGVTNLWVNPDIIYKKIKVDGKNWIVSAECA